MESPPGFHSIESQEFNVMFVNPLGPSINPYGNPLMGPLSQPKPSSPKKEPDVPRYLNFIAMFIRFDFIYTKNMRGSGFAFRTLQFFCFKTRLSLFRSTLSKTVLISRSSTHTESVGVLPTLYL